MADNDDEIKDTPDVAGEDEGPASERASSDDANPKPDSQPQPSGEGGEQKSSETDESSQARNDTNSPAASDIDTSLNEEPSAEVEEEIVDELDRIAANQHDGVVISKGLSIEPNKEKVKILTILKNFVKNISPEVKKKTLIASSILLMAGVLVYFLVQGQLLPRFAFPYKVSYKKLAQEVYSYPTDGMEVPLFDDSRSKAFTVALPKATINLLGGGEEPDYGEFEFFLNLRDRDLVAQVNAQQSDIMEIVRGILEKMSWSDLQTPIGKDRLKKQIRADVNNYLGGNMVLSVYYRSVILSR